MPAVVVGGVRCIPGPHTPPPTRIACVEEWAGRERERESERWRERERERERERKREVDGIRLARPTPVPAWSSTGVVILPCMG